MNPGRFFMPNFGVNPMMRSTYMIPREANIFSKLFSNIKNINLSKILTSANKTLNVMNQAIPLIRQAGPIVNNAKSMLHLAKVFRNETTPIKKKYYKNTPSKINNTNNFKQYKTIINNNDAPTFFI